MLECWPLPLNVLTELELQLEAIELLYKELESKLIIKNILIQ